MFSRLNYYRIKFFSLLMIFNYMYKARYHQAHHSNESSYEIRFQLVGEATKLSISILEKVYIC